MAGGFTEVLHAYIWAGIGWMMFCRIRKVGPDARQIVQLSLSAVATASLAVAAAPFIRDWGFTVRPLDLILGGSLFALFAAFEQSWRNGPPDGVRSESYTRADRAALADSQTGSR